MIVTTYGGFYIADEQIDLLICLALVARAYRRLSFPPSMLDDEIQEIIPFAAASSADLQRPDVAKIAQVEYVVETVVGEADWPVWYLIWQHTSITWR